MPANGRVFECEEFELALGFGCGGFTHSGSSDPAKAVASLLTRFWTSLDAEAIGVYAQIDAKGHAGGSAVTNWLVSIPSLSLSWSDTSATAETSSTLTVHFYDLVLRAMPTNLWRLDCSEIEVKRDGVSEQTWTGPFEMTADAMIPSAVPLLGVPARIEASVGGVAVPCGAGGSPTEFSVSGECDGSGGWRFKQDAVWYSLPVFYDELAFPAQTCGCDEAPEGSNSATNTSNLAVHAVMRASISKATQTRVVLEDCAVTQPLCCSGSAWYDWDLYTVNFYADNGRVEALPNLVRSIERLNADYKALWHRFSLPWVKKQAYSSCSTGDTCIDPVTITVTAEEEVFPEQAALLQRVGNSPAAIEDTFGYDIVAPYKRLVAGYTEEWGVVTDSEQCFCAFPCSGPPVPGVGDIVPGTEEYCGFENFSQLEGANAAPAGDVNYLATSSPIDRYIDYVACPHWSFAYFFDDWDPFTRLGYWLATRQQFLVNPEDSRATTGARNSIVSCPLKDGGWHTLTETILSGLKWIGVSRFYTDEVVPAVSYAYGSGDSALFEETDCVLTHGAQITVNPDPGTTTVSFRLRLGSYEDGPRLYPHACDRFLLDWSATNIDAVRAYLVSIDGSSRTLLEQTPGDGFTTAGATYPRPEAGDAKYAGTWAIDNGNGEVDDTGVDSEPEGASAAMMADPERTVAPMLLGGYGARYLEIEIDVTDPDVDCTFEYPEVLYSDGVPGLTNEHGQASNLVFPDGPGLLFGRHKWYDGAHNETPDVLGLGYKATAVDWLSMRRVLFEGLAYDDGLTTELSAIYDSDEGQTVAAANADSIAFILPMAAADETVRAAIVNCFAEVPPMCCFPRQARSLTTWLETEGHAQIAYSWAQEPRRTVSRDGPIHLRRSGSVWTTGGAAPASGWSETHHSHDVTNNEDPDSDLLRGSTKLAEASPWHGYFGVCRSLGQGRDPANLHTPQGSYFRASIEEGNVWVRQTDFTRPEPVFAREVQVTDSELDSEPHLGYDWTTGAVLLVWTREDPAGTFNVYGSFTHDEGQTWSDEELLVAGRTPKVFGSPDGTIVRTRFVYDSGSSGPGKVYAQRKKPGETAHDTAAPVVDDTDADMSFEDDGYDISQGYDGPHSWLLVAKLEGEAEPKEFVSYDDCASFIEV